MWANGETSMGLVPNRKKQVSRREKDFDRDWHDFNEVKESWLGEKKLESYSFNDRGQTLGQKLTERAEKRERERSPKGRKGITGYGARCVRNGCHLLEKRYGRSRLAMVTPTLPNVPEYLGYWVLQWHELVRKYLQEVSRELKRKDAPLELIGVTEIHPKRSVNQGYAIPHLHFIHVAWSGYRATKNAKRDWYITADRHREMWQSILINEVKRLGIYNPEIPVPLPRVNTELVRKSAEGYLGKYMSKGKESLQKLQEKGVDMYGLPSQWWTCSKKLRAVIKGTIRELPTDILAAILQKVDLVKRGVVYFMREVKRETRDGEKLFGYYFKLKPSWSNIRKSELIQIFDTA